MASETKEDTADGAAKINNELVLTVHGHRSLGGEGIAYAVWYGIGSPGTVLRAVNACFALMFSLRLHYFVQESRAHKHVRAKLFLGVHGKPYMVGWNVFRWHSDKAMRSIKEILEVYFRQV